MEKRAWQSLHSSWGKRDNYGIDPRQYGLSNKRAWQSLQVSTNSFYYFKILLEIRKVTRFGTTWTSAAMGNPIVSNLTLVEKGHARDTSGTRFDISYRSQVMCGLAGLFKAVYGLSQLDHPWRR